MNVSWTYNNALCKYKPVIRQFDEPDGHQTNRRGCCYLHVRAHARKSGCKDWGDAGLADHTMASRPMPKFINLFSCFFNSLNNMQMDKTSTTET